MSCSNLSSLDISGLFKDLISLGIGKDRVIIEMTEKAYYGESFDYIMKFPRIDTLDREIFASDILYLIWSKDFEILRNTKTLLRLEHIIESNWDRRIRDFMGGIIYGNEEFIKFISYIFNRYSYDIVEIKLIIDLKEIIHLQR